MRKWLFFSGISFTSLFLFASGIDITSSNWFIPLLGTIASIWLLYVCQKHLPEGFWEKDFQELDFSWEEEDL